MCADTPILKPTPLVVALSKELINQVNLQADGQHQDSSDKSTNIACATTEGSQEAS